MVYSQNEDVRILEILAEMLNDNISSIRYNIIDPTENKLNNLSLNEPDEIFYKSKCPSFALWSRKITPRETQVEKYYYTNIINPDNSIVVYKISGITLNNIVLSILCNNNIDLIELRNECYKYLNTLGSIQMYNETDDGFNEYADVEFKYISLIRNSEYPFTEDLIFDVTYMTYTIEDHYPVEDIEVDIETVDYLEEVPPIPPTINTEYEITQPEPKTTRLNIRKV